MTSTRVTVGSIAYSGLDAIRATSSNLAAVQGRMSSGQQITRPSDDPLGTVQAMGLRSQLARNDQYGTNSDDALAWLSTADSTYNQMSDVLQKARTLVVQGLNAGGNDATSYNAIAQQVTGLRNSLLALANTPYNGRPLFGGTTAGGAAYDTSGSYVGDSGAVTRAVGPNTVVQVSQDATTAFGSGGNDVFSLLSSIATALQTNPASLTGSLAKMDTAISRLSSAQAGEGASYNQVQQAQSTQTTTGTALTTRLSSIVDIDPAQTAIALSTANTAYQAALQTTASIRQLSLLNFLK